MNSTIGAGNNPVLCAKAFLAIQQCFPGIGNGVLQDILYEAGVHPKRKVYSLSDEDIDRLELSVVSTLLEMIRLGGRDTGKDLFDQNGGYVTAMSKNTAGKCLGMMRFYHCEGKLYG